MDRAIFSHSDLAQLSHVHGNKHHVSPADIPSTAVADGQFHLSKTVSDVLLHISDMQELEPISITCERSAELTIGVLTEGKLQFALDDQEVTFEVARGERPLCFAFNTLRPTQWRRDLIKGNRVKKALVCIPHLWLKKRFKRINNEETFLQNLALRHSVILSCPANFQLNNIANKLITCGKNQPSEIELEGLSLILLAECIKALTENTSQQENIAPSNASTNPANPTSLRICQFIEEHISEGSPPTTMDLKHIAKQLGISVSTAQRQFKQHFKITIMEYIRSRRLDLARTQLQNHLSIGEVAYMAGYTHTSNFSLAFKKHFGVSPGDVCSVNCKK